MNKKLVLLLLALLSVIILATICFASNVPDSDVNTFLYQQEQAEKNDLTQEKREAEKEDILVTKNPLHFIQPNTRQALDKLGISYSVKLSPKFLDYNNEVEYDDRHLYSGAIVTLTSSNGGYLEVELFSGYRYSSTYFTSPGESTKALIVSDKLLAITTDSKTTLYHTDSLEKIVTLTINTANTYSATYYPTAVFPLINGAGYYMAIDPYYNYALFDNNGTMTDSFTYDGSMYLSPDYDITDGYFYTVKQKQIGQNILIYGSQTAHYLPWHDEEKIDINTRHRENFTYLITCTNKKPIDLMQLLELSSQKNPKDESEDFVLLLDKSFSNYSYGVSPDPMVVALWYKDDIIKRAMQGTEFKNTQGYNPMHIYTSYVDYRYANDNGSAYLYGYTPRVLYFNDDEERITVDVPSLGQRYQFDFKEETFYFTTVYDIYHDQIIASLKEDLEKIKNEGNSGAFIYISPNSDKDLTLGYYFPTKTIHDFGLIDDYLAANPKWKIDYVTDKLAFVEPNYGSSFFYDYTTGQKAEGIYYPQAFSDKYYIKSIKIRENGEIVFVACVENSDEDYNLSYYALLVYSDLAKAPRVLSTSIPANISDRVALDDINGIISFDLAYDYDINWVSLETGNSLAEAQTLALVKPMLAGYIKEWELLEATDVKAVSTQILNAFKTIANRSDYQELFTWFIDELNNSAIKNKIGIHKASGSYYIKGGSGQYIFFKMVDGKMTTEEIWDKDIVLSPHLIKSELIPFEKDSFLSLKIYTNNYDGEQIFYMSVPDQYVKPDGPVLLSVDYPKNFFTVDSMEHGQFSFYLFFTDKTLSYSIEKNENQTFLLINGKREIEIRIENNRLIFRPLKGDFFGEITTTEVYQPVWLEGLLDIPVL